MSQISVDMRTWAVAGAQNRLLEIAAEAAEIHRMFPELRGGRSQGVTDVASKPATGGRRRRTMSAAARARISAAQKARWAKQKAEATSSPAAVLTSRKKK